MLLPLLQVRLEMRRLHSLLPTLLPTQPAAMGAARPVQLQLLLALLRLMLRKRAPLVQHVLLQLGLRLSQHRRPPVPSLHRLFWHRILFP